MRSSRPATGARDERGFLYVEALLAIGLLLFILVSTMPMFILASRQSALWDAADTLAKDAALRQAIFADEADGESLFVALNNHRVRTGADLALLLELDGSIRVDTRDGRYLGRS